LQILIPAFPVRCRINEKSKRINQITAQTKATYPDITTSKTDDPALLKATAQKMNQRIHIEMVSRDGVSMLLETHEGCMLILEAPGGQTLSIAPPYLSRLAAYEDIPPYSLARQLPKRHSLS
jgi:hypothetical protein